MQRTPQGVICALRDRYGRSHSTVKACIPGTGRACAKTSKPRLHCVYFLADRAIRWVAVPNTNEGTSPPRLQQVGKLTADPHRNWAPWVLTISGRAHIRTFSPNTPVSLCSVSKGVLAFPGTRCVSHATGAARAGGSSRRGKSLRGHILGWTICPGRRELRGVRRCWERSSCECGGHNSRMVAWRRRGDRT